MAAAELTITNHLAEEIRNHGVEKYPHECCGALLGRDTIVRGQEIRREIHALHPLVNRREDSPQNRFSVTAADVREAEKAAQELELEVVGWYHSHPDHPASPSTYDREHAWPWYSYIIVSIANRRAEDMTSWRLTENREEFLPEPIALHQKHALAE